MGVALRGRSQRRDSFIIVLTVCSIVVCSVLTLLRCIALRAYQEVVFNTMSWFIAVHLLKTYAKRSASAVFWKRSNYDNLYIPIGLPSATLYLAEIIIHPNSSLICFFRIMFILPCLWNHRLSYSDHLVLSYTFSVKEYHLAIEVLAHTLAACYLGVESLEVSCTRLLLWSNAR